MTTAQEARELAAKLTDTARYAAETEQQAQLRRLYARKEAAAMLTEYAALLEQAPVAWMWRHPTAFYGQPSKQLHFHGDTTACAGWSVTPLYAAPAPALPPLTDADARFAVLCREWLKSCSCAPAKNPSSCRECTNAFLSAVMDHAAGCGIEVGEYSLGMEDEPTLEPTDWHAIGMTWALVRAHDPEGSKDWTAGDVAAAFKAGAEAATGAIERKVRG